MRKFFERFRVRTQTHLFFHCDLRGTAADPRLGAIHWITATADPAFAALRSFTALQGFGADWPTDMLADHAQCALALDESKTPMAMAWMTTQAFHVEEIAATFDPGGSGYLFGDWVAPPFRGRRLQRMLVSYRLGRARELQISQAFTIIHPDNAASLKSYRQEGFVEEGRIETRTWIGRRTTVYTTIATPPRLVYENGIVRAV